MYLSVGLRSCEPICNLVEELGQGSEQNLLHFSADPAKNVLIDLEFEKKSDKRFCR